MKKSVKAIRNERWCGGGRGRRRDIRATMAEDRVGYDHREETP